MRFSIITCTKNSAKYLAENIASVKSQGFNDFEHIFIDGFSTDGTVEMIKKYQAEAPDKIKFFQFAPAGISAAMNRGIEKSSGEFLIHLHGDDSFYDDKVLSDVDIFLRDNPDLDWIYGLSNTIEADGRPVMIWPNKPFLHFHNYKSVWGRWLIKMITFIPHQAVFIRKTVFDKFGGFDESISTRMDPDLWMRIRNKTKWSFFHRVICNFRVHAGAESSSREKLVQNMKNLETVQKRYMNALEFFLAKILNRIRTRRNKALR
jgi:glycosyltransferase involved in cell wall biosynthesis